MTPIGVPIVEDHAPVRAGLRTSLETVAERLNIGLGTVKGHVADILEKLAASDRAQAAVTAYRRGLIR